MWSDGINSFDGQGGEILSQCKSIPNHYQVYFKYLNFVNYTSTKLNFFKCLPKGSSISLSKGVGGEGIGIF